MRPDIRIVSVLVAGLVLAGASALAPPAAAAEATPVKSMGTSVRATGTITAIDMASRHVTIRDSEGQEETFAVGKSVRLERAKVGDQVQVDYSIAVAVSLKKGGGAAVERVEAASASRTPSAATPGVQAVSRTTVTADVLAVDQAKQTLRLKGPEGHVVDVKVRDKQAMADVKPGDQVIADVTEAVAINLKPQAAGAASAASAH
jgi:hypothetical protein